MYVISIFPGLRTHFDPNLVSNCTSEDEADSHFVVFCRDCFLQEFGHWRRGKVGRADPYT